MSTVDELTTLIAADPQSQEISLSSHRAYQAATYIDLRLIVRMRGIGITPGEAAATEDRAAVSRPIDSADAEPSRIYRLRVPSSEIAVDTYPDVLAVLSDPRMQVPDAAAGDGAFLDFRRRVSRYSSGANHRERRELILALLAGMDPDRLRQDAVAGTERLLAEGPIADRAKFEMHCARTIPVAVMGAALGFTEPADLAGPVSMMAGPYASGTVSDPTQMDDAITALLGRARGDHPVLRAQLLLQTFTATAALIGSVLASMPSEDIGATIRRVLEHRPPVAGTRRVATTSMLIGDHRFEPGATALVNLRARPAGGAGASLAFGSGPRACPAPAHAVAITHGVVAVLTASGRH